MAHRGQCLGNAPSLALAYREDRLATMIAKDHNIRAIFFDFGGVILEGFDGVDDDRWECRDNQR